MQIRNNHLWLVLLLTFVVGMSPLVLNADAHQSDIDETEHHSYSEHSHESDNSQNDHSPSAESIFITAVTVMGELLFLSFQKTHRLLK